MTVQSLVDFLMQRIAEDEAVARAATPGAWYWEPPSGESFPQSDESLMSTVADDEGGYTSVLVGWGYDASGIEGRNEDRAHITRYQPARALAECAAKRRIVKLHKFGPGYRQRQPWEPEWPQPEYVREVCGECYEWDEDDDCASNAVAPCATIRTMAQVYSDHPDYRQDWAR